LKAPRLAEFDPEPTNTIKIKSDDEKHALAISIPISANSGIDGFDE